MDLASIGYLDAVKAVELREKCIRVFLDMIIVVFKNFPEELVLCVMDRLDNIFVVPREIEETTTLSWGT